MPEQSTGNGQSVFSGIRVVEVGSFVAAPAAATILADFGADVVKIEPPGTGDPWRVQFSRPGLPRSPHNFLWTLTGRNKRSVALDLKSADGQVVFDRIIESADVFVTNLPLNVRSRLALQYERLAQKNPRLIYASLTGYGEAGEEMHDKAFDSTAWWGRSGLMDGVRADSQTAPARGVSAMGDHNTALAMFGAIASALFYRERSGKGAYVRSSLMANGAWTNGSLIQAALFGAKFEPKPPRSRAPNPLQNHYECKDGRWLIVIINFEQQERNWPMLVSALDLPELLKDPRFATPRACQSNSEALVGILDKTFLGKSAHEWREALKKHGITAGIVARPEDAATDLQMRAAEAVVPLEGVEGSEFTVSSPFSFRDTPKITARRGPRLGEHTDNVLREVGIDAADLTELRKKGIVA